MMQKGIGSMFSSDGNSSGGVMSAISNILGGSKNNLSQDHELVRHVQQTCNIQDPQQATQYTQQGVSVMNEHGNSNPQVLQSLVFNLTGGGNKDGTSGEAGKQQDQTKKKGLLGDVMSGLGI